MVSYRKLAVSDPSNPITIVKGAKYCFAINIGADKSTIKKLILAAPSLNKTTDLLNFSILTKNTITPGDEDYAKKFSELLSDDGPWTNYHLTILDDIITYDAENNRYIYLLVENLAANSNNTELHFEMHVNCEMEG